MNVYIKTIAIALAALGVSAAVAARSAEPDVIVLPAPVVINVLQYLNTRPYQDVANIMANLQRCLQDQVPDEKGTINGHGGCFEITAALHQLKMPLVKDKPPAP